LYPPEFVNQYLEEVRDRNFQQMFDTVIAVRSSA
jgi:hypothetical protein